MRSWHSIYDNYLPMLDAGATTVWEVFPTSGDRPAASPPAATATPGRRPRCTSYRGSCWASVRSAAGGTAYEISPWVAELEWARGAICTANGLLEVSWRRAGSQLSVMVKAPPGVQVSLARNESMRGLETQFIDV